MRGVDIAERLGMSQSSVTRLIGPLDRRGVLDRITDPSDARASLACLTTIGREVVEEALQSAGSDGGFRCG